MTADYRTIDGIAVITLRNAPVNALDSRTRQSLDSRLRDAFGDDEIRAVVLLGGSGTFSAGSDITEIGTTAALSPSLGSVTALLDAAPKPVVAALVGRCLGGGFELALAAHYRVASGDCIIGLPEVKLGLVPGWGGTQRLPRAIDPVVAVDMIATGTTRTADELADLHGQRLLDRVHRSDVLAEAMELAHKVAEDRPLPRVRDLPPPVYDEQAFDAVKARVRKRSRGAIAPVSAIDLVQSACFTSFDRAVEIERATFDRLAAGDESAAMRHTFFAERTARQLSLTKPETVARRVESVAVIGAGTMGGGIAMNFLEAGIPTTVLETTREALDRGLSLIDSNYRDRVRKGALTEAEMSHRLSFLAASLNYDDVADADLVIEAVFENMDVKRTVFERLDKIMKPGAVLASNTSTLDLDSIAAVTSRPSDVVGLHFFSPANVMPLLEVVRADKTADDVLITAMAVAKTIGKTAVVSAVCDGFIGNRMLAKYREAAVNLLRSGITPQQVDSAMEGFGFAMGPFRVSDLAGNDIGWAIRKRRYLENPDMERDDISDALCELGRFGQKTGAGWYDYEPGSRVPRPSAEVDELLGRFVTQSTGDTSLSPASIAERLVYALVDEGARILDEGIAIRSSDIDVVYVAGYGFPRHRGGPMYFADSVGLATVLESLRRAHEPGWVPSPLLVRLAATGSTFSTV